MLKLISNNFYELGNFKIEVQGINSTVLSNMMAVCQRMDRQVKQRLIDISKDDDLSSCFVKLGKNEQLTASEMLAITNYSNQNQDDFTIDECKVLYDAIMPCVVAVIEQSTNADVTAEFKTQAQDVPAYLRGIANMAYSEYKAAIEIPGLKKI